jgi:putative peptide zinc metalloprotease protein
LVSFACATWLYRLSLFLGIALLIYMMFPKAAGLPLAAVEVHFFILRPILREMKEWHGMGLKKLFLTSRALVTGAVVLAAAILSLLPLDRHVLVPSIFVPAKEARLFSAEPAIVLKLEAKAGDHVQQGQLLARLFVPDIGHLQRIAQLRLKISEERLQRVAADVKDLAEVRVLEQERMTILAELAGLHERNELLFVRAPMEGVLSGDASPLREGQWVGQQDLLFHVADPRQGRIIGLVAEREAGRLLQGAAVSFVSVDGMRFAISGVVTQAGMPGAEGFAAGYLSSQFGGPIAVNTTAQGEFEPMTGRIPLMIATDSTAPEIALTGTAKIAAEPQSFASFLLGRLVTVMMRESGF